MALPSWIEEESRHFSGAWTLGFYRYLESLRTAIVEKKRYTWRTEREWRRHIQNSNKGAFKATAVTTEDWDLGRRLVDAAFPIGWNLRRIFDIALPENYVGASEATD
ncbi:hypothetical protein K438DRAFT_1987933 [Mycena galopus ATCC 62051]|nr:hypothetical protein K438DRAFT_1987933 [Mycena galopus ATCC 62051]